MGRRRTKSIFHKKLSICNFLPVPVNRQSFFSTATAPQIAVPAPAAASSAGAKPAASSAPPSRPVRELPPPIKLTEGAADRIKYMMVGKDNALGVRLSVKRRGCNGYSYVMNYANKEDEQELKKYECVKSHGVLVYVDPKAIFFLVGTEMDYIDNELASEFTFINPNSKGSCGCGESFNV